MKFIGALVTVLALISSGYIYPSAMTVTEIESDLVAVSTSTGNEFQFYGADDYEVGDLVAAIMCSNGTETVNDDSILCVRYAG